VKIRLALARVLLTIVHQMCCDIVGLLSIKTSTSRFSDTELMLAGLILYKNDQHYFGQGITLVI